MSIPTVYTDPKKFWREVSPELKKEEAKNNLCLGLAYAFQADPTGCIYQVAARGPSGLLGAFICSQRQNRLNLITSPIENINHAEYLLSEFKKRNLAITDIIGETKTADIYKKLIESASGQKFKIHMNQGIYSCSKVIMPEVADNLKFRVARPSDIQKIGEWIEAFHREAVPHDPPVNGQDAATARINNGQIYVIEKNGVLVSMAGWSRDIKTSCSVNLVYTPSVSRKNGFASIVTAQLTQHLLKRGKKETTLYTDMTNPISNRIYQNIGYQFVCDSVHLGGNGA